MKKTKTKYSASQADQEQKALWKMLHAHEAKHGCASLFRDSKYQRDCPVRRAMLSAWCEVKNANMAGTMLVYLFAGIRASIDAAPSARREPDHARN